MRIIKVIIFGLFCFSGNAFAGGVGNGGDVIVCRNGETISSIEIYDHFEAREIRKLNINLGASNFTRDQVLDLLIGRIRRINPGRAAKYENWRSTFFQEAQVLSGITLIDIPDTGAGYIPTNCKLEQIAVQQVPQFQGDSRYTINKDLWSQMSAQEQAGLVMHEIILREAISPEVGDINSVNTRYFHSVISTSEFVSMKLKPYIELLQTIGFQTADAQGGVPIFAICGKTCPAWIAKDNDNARSGIEKHPGPFFFDEDTISTAYAQGDQVFEYEFKGQKISGILDSLQAWFYSNGALQNSIIASTKYLEFNVAGQVVVLKNWRGTFDFYGNGDLMHLIGDLSNLVENPNTFQLNLPYYVGPANTLFFKQDNRLSTISKYLDASIAKVFFYGKWWDMVGGTVDLATSEETIDPHVDYGVAARLSSGNFKIDNCWMIFDKKSKVLVGCRGETKDTAGQWYGADGRTWEVQSSGRLLDGIRFLEDGSLKYFTLGRKYSESNLKLSQGHAVTLYPSGKIKSVEQKYEDSLIIALYHGQWVKAKSCELNENGDVTRCDF